VLKVDETLKDIFDGKKGRGPNPHEGSPFGSFLKDGTPYLSPSQVILIHSCAAAWAFRYLEKKLQKPALAPILGSLGHKIIETAITPLRLGELSKFQDLEQLFLNELVEVCSDPRMVELTRATGEAKARAKGIQPPEEQARLILNSAWPGVTRLGTIPGKVLLEEDCHIKLDVDGRDVALRYVPDLYAPEAGLIIDWKFGSKKPSTDANGKNKASPEHAISQLLYALGHNWQDRRVDHVEVGYMPLGSGAYHAASLTPTMDRMAEARRLFERAARIVVRGELHGNPISAGWRCSPSMCEHHGYCPDSTAALGVEADASA
jgi:hypothetical protein